MPERIGKCHITNELRDEGCGKEYDPGSCVVPRYRVLHHQVDNEQCDTGANPNHPDVGDWGEESPAFFSEKVIPSIEEPGEDRHDIPDPKARVEDEISTHDQERTGERDGKSTPERA